MSGIRGLEANASGTAMWTVSGNTLYSVDSSGGRIARGSLLTSRGTVGMQAGLTQLVVVDGTYLYVLELETNVFTRVTDDAWLGSKTVGYLDGHFIFVRPGTQTFYISEPDNALSIDPLDTHDEAGSPDLLVAVVTDNREAWLLGASTIGVWQNTGGDEVSDFAFTRNKAAFIQTGCLAAFTAKTIDNTIYWLGQDEDGGGMVYRAEGYRAARISKKALDQKIQASQAAGNDVRDAVAYAYQQDGNAFYCLQVPGLDTTWVYEISSGEWAERAEWVDGKYAQHRGDFHCFCYGKHVIGGADSDQLYTYEVDVYTNAGDPLVRNRISPHYATPQLDRVRFSRFDLDCTVGKGRSDGTEALVQMRYSDDGSPPVGTWRTATLGKIGERSARASFRNCGTARDRVWEVRCTDNVPFAIVDAVVRT